MKQIIDSLKNVFAKYDAETTLNHIEWAKSRVEAIKKFKSSEEYRESRKNIWDLYAKLYAVAGGKTWYKVFDGRCFADIEQYMVKNAKATFDKRNSSIANKLEKAGVTQVLSEEYVYTDDGFNGVFVVDTTSGKKVVTITTIIAGGYNVQCVHNRVLVKVK